MRRRSPTQSEPPARCRRDGNIARTRAPGEADDIGEVRKPHEEGRLCNASASSTRLTRTTPRDTGLRQSRPDSSRQRDRMGGTVQGRSTARRPVPPCRRSPPPRRSGRCATWRLDERRLDEHRAWAVARRERSLCCICPVGKDFRHTRQSRGVGQFEDGRSGQREQGAARRTPARRHDSRSLQVVPHDHVVERTVRTHAGHPGAAGPSHGVKRSELVDHVGGELVRVHVDDAATETFTVAVGDLGADPHATLHCDPADMPHRRGCSGVTGRQVGARDDPMLVMARRSAGRRSRRACAPGTPRRRSGRHRGA